MLLSQCHTASKDNFDNFEIPDLEIIQLRSSNDRADDHSFLLIRQSLKLYYISTHVGTGNSFILQATFGRYILPFSFRH